MTDFYIEHDGRRIKCAGFITDEDALEALNNPPEPSVEQVKRSALRQIDGLHAEILKNATGKKSLEERDTWQPKAIAAQALVDGTANDAQTAMLETEAAARSVTPVELAQTVLAKSAAYHGLIGSAAALRSSAKQQIEAAETKEQVAEILAEANSQATALQSNA